MKTRKIKIKDIEYKVNIINNKIDELKNFFNKNNNIILLKNSNSFNTYFYRNKDFIVLNNKMAITHIYRNIPKFKIINLYESKEKTSVLILSKNTSIGLKIGDVLFFESEHII